MWNLAQGIHSKALEIFIIYLLLLQLLSQFPILICNYNLNQKLSNPQPNRQKSGPTEIWLTALDLASRVLIMKACRPCWVSWTTNSSDAIEFLDFNLEFFSLAILSNTSFVAGKRDSYMCGHCAKTKTAMFCCKKPRCAFVKIYWKLKPYTVLIWMEGTLLWLGWQKQTCWAPLTESTTDGSELSKIRI